MLTRDDVESRLNMVFRDTFEDDDILIHDAMTADEVDGWDSVSHITLVLMTEKEFGVRFGAAEVGGLKNVGQMIDLILARANK
jgi:acyl carrier protein